MLEAYQRWSYGRYTRTVKRKRTEEIMGWICVPLIVGVVWVGYTAYDSAMTERAKPRETRSLIPDTSVVSRAR